jgi:predicted amidohydrolase
MCARQNVEANLDTCEALVGEAAERGAELLVLPENFPFIGGLKEKLTLAEPLDRDNPGPILARMQELAREHRLHLVLGGMPVLSENPQRFYNTLILLDSDGTVQASYRKIHLFDVNIPGGAEFQESEYVLPGEEVVSATALETTIGFSICYDLRFPELYRELSRQGATIVCVPAAFTLHTGKDHWFPLLRARAIENQSYILAAAQHGQHTPQRTSFGKACIVDPWGAVVAQVPDGDGIAVADLDLGNLAKIRLQLPCLSHRRL